MSTERPLVIINSGAYVETELVAEFGLLPAAFLPLGVGRVYELQASVLQTFDADVVMTLPESYQLASWDEARLKALGIGILRTSDGLTIGQALLRVLGHVGFTARPLRILHGDTFVSGIDLTQDDALAVAPGRDGYRWAYITIEMEGSVSEIHSTQVNGNSADQRHRLCGYMAFSSLAEFAEALTVSDGDFIASLNHMAKRKELKALEPREWLDFGHVQTFFRSRRVATTQRAFNSLEITATTVRKRSRTAADKLRSEARWLREVPPEMAPFCARLLAEGEDGSGYFYDTEYEHMPTLAELHVFGRLSLGSWETIFNSCQQFIDISVAAAKSIGDMGAFKQLVVEKTQSRLSEYCRLADIDIDAPTTLNSSPGPSLRECLEGIDRAVVGSAPAPSVMHGDFCFSNILYSMRTERIRVIDPRATQQDGEYALFGDCRYDLAKLMHSVFGRYDMIVAGRYSGRRTGKQDFELNFKVFPIRFEIENYLLRQTMGGVKLSDDSVWAAMVSLFLSMPPLHYDRPDRQHSFIANALRLYMSRN